MDGDLTRLRGLISSGNDVNSRDEQDLTPLHLAAFSGNLEIVRELVELGANVNDHDNYYRTALHFATIKGDLAIVDYLISQGANPSITDYEEDKPFNYACDFGREDLIAYLGDLELEGEGVC